MSYDPRHKNLSPFSSLPKSWDQRNAKIFPEVILSSKPRKSDSTEKFLEDSDDTPVNGTKPVQQELRDSYSPCHFSLTGNNKLLNHLRQIAGQFRRRTDHVKEWVVQPPTPSTPKSGSSNAPISSAAAHPSPSLSTSEVVSFFSTRKPSKTPKPRILFRRIFHTIFDRLRFPYSIEPQSNLYISWLGLLSCCFLYNLFTITLRTIFSEYQTEENIYVWLTLDYTCDFFYIVDIVVFKIKLKFLHDGKWLLHPKEIRRVYFKKKQFVIDTLSLLPFDALYFVFGPYPILRASRLLKVHTFWEFFSRLDEVLASPFIARMTKATIYMVYTIHFYALGYYGLSKYEGIGSNTFVYNGEGNAYVRCYFFAIKTATSIGKNPKPVNILEQSLMTFAWLLGVFIFAVLIGQVKDIVLTASHNQDEYRTVVDRTTNYLQRNFIPQETISKVRLWLTFTWETQKVLDEVRPLLYLPYKMQMDIAINVHIKTLSKVQLFQDCDENLLRDLVLKLKPVLFLPDDYVCRKGEVGKEMYIVQSGHVQVMGGIKNNVVLVTLSEGSVFGEISLLSIGGGNRRTADVKSQGFSQLFVLSKQDLQTAISDYPQAQEVLKKKAEKLIRQNKQREVNEKPIKSIIPCKVETPKLFKTLTQIEKHSEQIYMEDKPISSYSAVTCFKTENSGTHSIRATEDYIIVTIEDEKNKCATDTEQERKDTADITLEQRDDHGSQDLACWVALSEEGQRQFQKSPMGRKYSIASQDQRIPSTSLITFKPRNGKLKKPQLQQISKQEFVIQKETKDRNQIKELTLVNDLHAATKFYSNHMQAISFESAPKSPSRSSISPSIPSPNIVRVSTPFKTHSKQRRGLLNFGTPPDESTSSCSSIKGEKSFCIGNGSSSLISISSRDSFDLSARACNLSSESELEKLDGSSDRGEVMPRECIGLQEVNSKDPQGNMTFLFKSSRNSF